MDPTGLRIVAPAGESVLSPDREHVVGRGRDCDVVIADGRVSRRHLRLEPSDDSWLARDISSNGIWVDGTRRVSVPLTGSEVRVHLGTANGPLVVLIPPPPPPRPAAPPAAPDVADQETVLAGEGTRQPARSLLPHQIGPPPEAPAAGHPGGTGRRDGTAGRAATTRRLATRATDPRFARRSRLRARRASRAHLTPGSRRSATVFVLSEAWLLAAWMAYDAGPIGLSPGRKQPRARCRIPRFMFKRRAWPWRACSPARWPPRAPATHGDMRIYHPRSVRRPSVHRQCPCGAGPLPLGRTTTSQQRLTTIALQSDHLPA